MDCTEISVLEQSDKVCLRCLLKSKHGGALETEIRLEVLCNFSNESLKRKLADEELCGFLEPADFSKGDGTGAISVRLLDTADSRG